MEETKYVAGFMFSPDETAVALIRKNKPAWQAGKLNGIGGKIEPGENPLEAMCREFKEETGVGCGSWQQFAVLRGAPPDGAPYCVYFFYCKANMLEWQALHTTTDEEVVRVPYKGLWYGVCIPNITWLIPMAASMLYDQAAYFRVTEVY